MYYYYYRYNYYATECNFLRGWETQKVNRIKRKNSWTWNICYENPLPNVVVFFNFCIIFLCHSPHPLLNPFPFISLFYFSKCTIFFPLFFSFSSSQTTPPCCSLTQTHTGTTHRLPYNFSNVYNASMAVYFCYVVFFCQYCSSILPQRNGQLFGAGVWRGAQSPHHSPVSLVLTSLSLPLDPQIKNMPQPFHPVEKATERDLSLCTLWLYAF